mgnify:CR=1 FL=1
MALTAVALTTVDALRTHLCASDSALSDPRAESLIIAASRELMRLAGGRHFERGAGLVHDVEGYGTQEISAPRFPIASITSVALLSASDGTVTSTYDSTDYRISNAEAGLVYRAYGWPWTTISGDSIRGGGAPGHEAKLIRLTYDAGWITPHQATAAGGSLGARDLPEDIEQACLDGAALLYHQDGRDRSITSERLGNASVTYAASSLTQGGSWLPMSAQAVALAYWGPGL